MSPPDVPPPSTIGEYHLLREIGRGGMGVVYEARHSLVGRHVALKILPQRLSRDTRALARFRHEARTIAEIHHTNVVPLYQFGNDDGQYFLVMQLIDGVSVDRLIAKISDPELGPAQEKQTLREIVVKMASPLPADASFRRDAFGDEDTSDVRAKSITDSSTVYSTPELPVDRYAEVALIGLQIASALHYAHERGVFHRDVKPSNIMLDGHGIAWLTDFGLAKTDEEDLTETGDMLGTLRYTAPERFQGKCDARSDLYALGLTLYELLSRRPAFDAKGRIKLIETIAKSRPPELKTTDAEIPTDLATIVTKAIELEPEARYPTANALAEDLQRYLSDEPIKARQMSVLERWKHWRRRQAALANSLIALAVVSTLTIIGAIGASIRESRLRGRAETAVVAELESRKAMQRTLYFAEMNLAGQAAQAAGGTQRVADYLDHWVPREGIPEMRGWEWHYLRSVSHREQSEIKTEGLKRVYTVCWSPDGSKVAMEYSETEIAIWDVVESKCLVMLSGLQAPVKSIHWSPDGKRLASGGMDHQLTIWDVINGEKERTYEFEELELLAVRWSPDSSHVACSNGRSLYLCDIETGAMPERVGEEDVLVITHLQWSPDGTQLFASNWWANRGGLWKVDGFERLRGIPGWYVIWGADGDGQDAKGNRPANWITTDSTGVIKVWDSAKEQPIQVLAGHTSTIRDLRLNADGSRLLSASDDRSLRIWDYKSGMVRQVLRGHVDGVFSAQWSPDGSQIASAADEDTVRVWDVLGGSIATMQTDGRVERLAWHPDSDRIASVSRRGTVDLWDVPQRKLISQLTGHPTPARSVRWSPDATKLVTSDREGTVRIWRSESWECLETLPGHDGTAIQVDWSPRGEELLSVGADKKVYRWDVASVNDRDADRWRDVCDIPMGPICIRWNPAGTLVAIGETIGAITILDSQSLRPVLRWRAHADRVVQLTWSPDGRQIASTSVDDQARVWAAEDGSLSRELIGHFGPVWGIDWNARGDRIATCSRDGTVRVWDPASGSESLRLRGVRRSGEFWSVQWSPDGRRLAAGSSNGAITIWDAREPLKN